MKTTHKDTPILGSAAFGTVDGLQVHGNGWLAGARSSFGVFEFALGRARDGDLHKTQPLTPVLFRRRCETAEGQGFELLGYLGPCRDKSGRAGYYGAAVAVPPDTVSPRFAIYEWDQPLHLAHSIFEASTTFVDGTGQLINLPGKLPQVATEDERDLQLDTSTDGNVLLHCENTAASDDLVSDLIKAGAFMGGARWTTIYCFHQPTPNSIPVDSPDLKQMLNEMNAKVQQRGKAARQPSSRGGSNPAQGAPARASESETYASLERRVADLSRRVAALEASPSRSQVYDRSYPTTSRQAPAPAKSGSSMFDDVDSGALEKAMPWIIGACIVLVICLIAYLAAYFLL